MKSNSAMNRVDALDRYVSGEPLRIGNHWQLLLDDTVVEDRFRLTRRLCSVVKHPRNPILTRDRPWEGDAVGRPLVFWDAEWGKYRFTPFIDRNPDVPPEARYKGLAKPGGGLQGYTSPDGIQPYFRAPHIYIGLPNRGAGRHDTVLMSSRDGKVFDRWAEAFLSGDTEIENWGDPLRFPKVSAHIHATLAWRTEGEDDPNSAKLVVLTGVSERAKRLPAQWVRAENGGVLSCPVFGKDLGGKHLWLKTQFSAGNPSASVRLREMVLRVQPRVDE